MFCINVCSSPEGTIWLNNLRNLWVQFAWLECLTYSTKFRFRETVLCLREPKISFIQTLCKPNQSAILVWPFLACRFTANHLLAASFHLYMNPIQSSQGIVFSTESSPAHFRPVVFWNAVINLYGGPFMVKQEK